MYLKLDQKYFKPVVFGTAIFLTFVIAVYSVDYAEKQRDFFVSEVKASTFLDTLTVRDVRTDLVYTPDSLRGKGLVLVFFAGWSERSLTFLESVAAYSKAHEGKFTVVGLLVKDQPDQIQDFMLNNPDLVISNGTALYGALKVSGIPAAISFDSSGNFRAAFTGNLEARIPELFGDVR